MFVCFGAAQSRRAWIMIGKNTDERNECACKSNKCSVLCVWVSECGLIDFVFSVSVSSRSKHVIVITLIFSTTSLWNYESPYTNKMLSTVNHFYRNISEFFRLCLPLSCSACLTHFPCVCVFVCYDTMSIGMLSSMMWKCLSALAIEKNVKYCNDDCGWLLPACLPVIQQVHKSTLNERELCSKMEQKHLNQQKHKHTR